MTRARLVGCSGAGAGRLCVIAAGRPADAWVAEATRRHALADERLDAATSPGARDPLRGIVDAPPPAGLTRGLLPRRPAGHLFPSRRARPRRARSTGRARGRRARPRARRRAGPVRRQPLGRARRRTRGARRRPRRGEGLSRGADDQRQLLADGRATPGERREPGAAALLLGACAAAPPCRPAPPSRRPRRQRTPTTSTRSCAASTPSSTPSAQAAAPDCVRWKRCARASARSPTVSVGSPIGTPRITRPRALTPASRCKRAGAPRARLPKK